MDTPVPVRATATERQAWESAARACYQEIGVAFPERVVWVSSPLVGAFAAPIAACRTTGHRNNQVLASVYRAVDATAGETVGREVRAAVQAATAGAVVRDPVHGAAATALHTDIAAGMDAAKASAREAAPTATREKSETLPASVLAALYEASGAVVREAVDEAVGGPRQDTVRGEIRRLWRAHLVGQRSRRWLDLVGCFRQDPTDPDSADPERPEWAVAAESLAAGWWWWPFRDFVMFSPAPAELHIEEVSAFAWPPRRPHRADGPAVGWPDGFGVYFWHGVHVPRAVIDDTLTTDEILREANAEVRRCAIERRGWDRFVAEAKLAQVGPAVSDPGNPGQTLSLHDVPADIYPSPVRVLLCTNGTAERDGSRRRFGLTVPTSCSDPIQAAAWTYGLTSEQYLTAQRRS